ncbi:MAG: dethiobiotin synthase [Rhodocyclaceae bacterium]
MRGVFITGTDTGVGKTFVGTALARLITQRGLRVRVRKPVESGCVAAGNPPFPHDAMALRTAAGAIDPLERVCPYRLSKPLSPERAAALEGANLELEQLHAACIRDLGSDDFLLVEGAGGFYSPIARGGLNADLAAELGMPVLLVVRDRLGAINQALLTAEAVRMRGLAVAGVVLNETDLPAPSDMDNAADIKSWLSVPLVRMPHALDFKPTGMDALAPLVDGWLATSRA